MENIFVGLNDLAGGYSIITAQRKEPHYFEIFHPFKPSKPTKLKISQHNNTLKSIFGIVAPIFAQLFISAWSLCTRLILLLTFATEKDLFSSAGCSCNGAATVIHF